MRAFLTSAALVALLFPAAVVAGAYVPSLPIVQRFGGFLTTELPLVALTALVPAILAGVALALGGGRITGLLGAVALVVVGATLTASGVLFLTAVQHGVSFSLARQAFPPGEARAPDRRVTFATVEGVPLAADLWLPRPDAPNSVSVDRPAVVFVHGGAFVAGGLGSRPMLFASLAESGHAVVDIEYRLAPPPRWDDAPADVLCALAWLADEAGSLGIDPSRVILMGESAGGSLALVAGYTAAGLDIVPSCGGTPIVPAGVVAIAPAADLEGIWADRTLWFEDRPFPEAYIGGPPSEFPDRFASASPFVHIRPDLPPTLVVAAGNDQLVRMERVTLVVNRLTAGGVDTRFIVVPFAEHGFDGHANGFGGQLLEQVVPAFVERVTP